VFANSVRHGRRKHQNDLGGRVAQCGQRGLTGC
jgi:hypothetical protein